MSGWVTVTGPPASICALNFGTTEPLDASTLPNRTEISRMARRPSPARRPNSSIERLAIHFRQPLGGAQHGDRLDRLVGRDHHHGGGAGRRRGIGDIDRAEHVGLDALVPVPFEQRHVLERGGVKYDIGLELRDQAHDPLAVADIGKPAGDFRLALLGRKRFQHGVQRGFGILDHQQTARRRR